ncbi:MAG: rRNA pseudouridine synthase [Chloroflexi bacterium]|nr:rRNA pseudouridine synthase [Chloroflexota bacterium]
MSHERLQKILARAGLGSRRACEALIEQGRVRVNGQVARLGQGADPARDQIQVDGAPLPAPQRPVYIALNKPAGVVCSRAAQDDRPTVIELVPRPERLYPVGRLDADSEGLVLLTNDGALAQRLTHPRYGHEKEYRVLVAGDPDERQLQAWRRGVRLPRHGPEVAWQSTPAAVTRERQTEGGRWLRVVMREGRKRQIRAIGAALGLPVLRIVRVRIGAVKLGDLRTGAHRELAGWEVERLRRGA